MEDYLSVQNKRMGELSISINIRIRLLNVRFELSTFFVSNTNIIRNKFALLWGEAQLCLPYVCLYKKNNSL